MGGKKIISVNSGKLPSTKEKNSKNMKAIKTHELRCLSIFVMKNMIGFD